MLVTLRRRRLTLARVLVTFLMFAWLVVPVQRCIAYASEQPSDTASMQTSDCAKMSRIEQSAPASKAKGGCVCAQSVAASTPAPIEFWGILPGHHSPQVAIIDRVTSLFESHFRQGRHSGFSTVSDAALFLPFDRQVVFLN